MSSCKLVPEVPFIKCKVAQVNGVLVVCTLVVSEGSGTNSGPGFSILPSIYPINPLDLNS